MNWHNCKTKDATKLTTVCDDDGNPFSFCNLCPRPKAKKINFPAILKGGRNKSIPIHGENGNGRDYSKYELSAADIAATQALRSKVGMVDTPQTRFLGDIEKVKRGERTIIYAGMQGIHCNRRAYVNKEAQAALGTDDFTIVADNGVKVIVDKNIKNGKRAYRKR